ncbi:hypothetical protein QZH41_008878, partial [Actinostola sp. cb2023]
MLSVYFTTILCEPNPELLSRDRFRTMLNVWGDAVGAGIVNHMSRDDLLELDAHMAENGEAGGHYQSPLAINSDDDDEDKKLPGQFDHETTFCLIAIPIDGSRYFNWRWWNSFRRVHLPSNPATDAWFTCGKLGADIASRVVYI